MVPKLPPNAQYFWGKLPVQPKKMVKIRLNFEGNFYSSFFSSFLLNII